MAIDTRVASYLESAIGLLESALSSDTVEIEKYRHRMLLIALGAVWEDDPDRQFYFAEVYAILRELLWVESDPIAFIRRLMELNQTHLRKIALNSYLRLGGTGAPPVEWLDEAAKFVNSFAAGFEAVLLERLAAGETFSEGDFENRAMLYPKEGYKMAVLDGQNWFMRERGANSWRRVLHPELSKTGPCPLCVEDSLVVHPIDEPFRVLHPNEVCSKQELFLQYFTNLETPSVEVPVPVVQSDWRKIVEDILGKTRSTIRRRRV